MKKLVAILTLALLTPLLLAVAGCGGRKAEDEETRLRSVETGAAFGTAKAGDAAMPAGEPAAFTAPEAAPLDGAVAVPQTSSLPSIGTRVVKTAFVRMNVPKGRFEETVDRARLIAEGHGGFVASFTASKGSGEELVRGTLVVRVPEGAYEKAISALGRLGKVEAREESGQDVSAQFVDLQARARHLEAVEAQLLKLLYRADEVAEALAVQAQLNAVQLELEQVRGQLRFLDDQTSYATISLDLHERGLAAAGKKEGGWGVVNAWREGAQGFVRVTAAVFVGVATAAPILLLIAAALVAGRFALVSRRRRSGGRPVEHAG